MISPRSYDKAHFIAFSNDAEPFATNARNYCESALKTGFESATHYTQDMLRETPFWADNAEILKQERGAGYWLWKPYLLLEKLRSVGPNDVVFYNDAGRYSPGSFEPFPRFPHAAAELCARLPNRFIHGFSTDWLAQGNYTKRDCLILMDADNEEMRRAVQISACPLVYMPSEQSFAFLEKWLELARDPRILTDLPDELGEPHDIFQEHRHDMAIASILAHQTGAHYVDLSRNGGFAQIEDIRRRNRHVPRLQTHIGYLSLALERAVPDDFFVRGDADIALAKGIIRNIAKGEAIPLLEVKRPAATLREAADEMIRSEAGVLDRTHIRALLGDNRVIAGHLHELGKCETEAAFWREVESSANAALKTLGPEASDARRSEACAEALLSAFAQDRDCWRTVLAGYVWASLDEPARELFKARFKSAKSKAGQRALTEFVDHVGLAEIVPVPLFIGGQQRAAQQHIARSLRDWLARPSEPAN